ncbi:hypothetical protein A9Q76_05660 [Arcobacter sp. 31_11_sub10_T18]|nr:hypothetical protein A9Q76_05660 [Arcobacter sp. 31_11_sub10_T18]
MTQLLQIGSRFLQKGDLKFDYKKRVLIEIDNVLVDRNNKKTTVDYKNGDSEIISTTTSVYILIDSEKIEIES